MWRAIQWYAHHGYQSLDFGRTSTTAAGLRRFKLSWGADERRIDYLRCDCRQNRFISEQDKAFGWYNSTMTRMPLLLLRILGAALYRHIA